MNWDADAERAAALGARRALAALGHELASPVSALRTFLKLAKGDGLAPIGRCADRIVSIVELARELAAVDEVSSQLGASTASDVGLAIESAAARLAVNVALERSGELLARIAPARASLVATALLRSVVDTNGSAAITVRVARRDDRISARIGPDIEPTAWRVVEPWRSGTGHRLDLWAAAVAASEDSVVRVGDVDGQIAVELELPVAEAR